jgi:site-specific DNA-cytosine methylase
VATLFFTKAKRAQNVNDYESWNEGGVAPTLNAMDNNGEAFATVLILAVDIYNASIDEKVTHTLKAANQPMGVPSILIIDGTRVNDVRVYEDGIVPTVISRYGTGGGNVPMVFPIQDGREIEKNQNGLGVGEQDAPAYTLDRTGGQSVAIPIQGTVIGRADTSGPQGKGYSDDGSPMFTLDRVSGHGVATESVVRRLTPVECERLQGFPDNWTDGQADSNRYKQMGNAVAVPVVEWIISRMVGEDETN